MIAEFRHAESCRIDDACAYDSAERITRIAHAQLGVDHFARRIGVPAEAECQQRECITGKDEIAAGTIVRFAQLADLRSGIEHQVESIAAGLGQHAERQGHRGGAAGRNIRNCRRWSDAATDTIGSDQSG